jgi:cobalt/nickel transport system permease protein
VLWDRLLARAAFDGARSFRVAHMSASHLLRSYAHLDSPIHRSPAALKLATTLIVVIVLALLPIRSTTWVCGIGALILVAMTTRLAGIPLSSLWARLALAQPFVLGVAVLALFQGGGSTIALAVAIKSTACVAVVQLLANTTPFRDLTDVLRRLRFPRVFVVTLELLHRYSVVLVEEARRMRRARIARTWGARRWSAWRALASVIAVSFVRSLTRSERIGVAMRARGWS